MSPLTEGFRTGRGSAFEGGNNFDADFDYFKQPSDEKHTMSKGTYGYRKSKLDKAFTSNGANLTTTCSFGKQNKMASRSGFGQPRKSNDGNSKGNTSDQPFKLTIYFFTLLDGVD